MFSGAQFLSGMMRKSLKADGSDGLHTVDVFNDTVQYA